MEDHEYPIVSDNPAIQAQYIAFRRAGQSHGMASIFATRRAPGAKTDREFFSGMGTLADQFRGEEYVLEKMVKIAESHGRKPHYTDVYQPGIANFPGDPEAFVPASGGRGHVQRVCEKRGLDCVGIVNVKSPVREPEPPKKPKRPPPSAAAESYKKTRRPYKPAAT